jgi:hypothetical protein
MGKQDYDPTPLKESTDALARMALSTMKKN